jgi:hypothetical protein
MCSRTAVLPTRRVIDLKTFRGFRRRRPAASTSASVQPKQLNPLLKPRGLGRSQGSNGILYIDSDTDKTSPPCGRSAPARSPTCPNSFSRTADSTSVRRSGRARDASQMRPPNAEQKDGERASHPPQRTRLRLTGYYLIEGDGKAHVRATSKTAIRPCAT